MTDLVSHLEIATGQNVAILLLCMCGMLLNTVMLVIFITKKQVRGSVYTTYMIQIAITDLLVCVVWLIMAAMYLDALPSASEIQKALKSESTDPAVLEQSVPLESKNFSVYRFIFAVYNFHYYNNIFLLATMSVERCVAVWKSLRCQRYKFNRKFIYAVSVVMWLVAFAFALPSFIDPNLITQSEQSDLGLRGPNGTATDFELSQKAPSSALIDCYIPLQHAIDENRTFVMDYDGVSIKECLKVMHDYGYQNVELWDYAIAEDGTDNPVYMPTYDDTEYPYDEPPSGSYDGLYEGDAFYNVDNPDGSNGTIRVVKRVMYHQLFKLSLNMATIITKTEDIDEVCDPRLNHAAVIYQVVVNLILGFFVPFFAIVVSYVSIAFMIGNRARHRLESDGGDDVEESSLGVGRRMSDFLRQFSHGGNNKQASDIATYNRGSPVLRRSLRKAKVRQPAGDKTPIHTDVASDSKQSRDDEVYVHTKTAPAAITLHPPSPSKSQDQGSNYAPVITRDPRPRLSSFSTTQLRRTSGGSASSVESFPTDQTSLHTSPSPGVRLSAPQFSPLEKTLVQRACSADSSTSGYTASHPAVARRWSSDVFRTSSAEEDRKVHERQIKESDSTYDTQEESSKPVSPMSPRGENPANESTQELLQGSHTRLYTPRQNKAYQRQFSSQSNCRSRAYSAASRSSAGGGTIKKTMVFKNAERQMRISRTVLAYVFVFALCWLPQRIVTLIYVTGGFLGMQGHYCHVATSSTRMISFLSVLLNPIVYAVTQRDIRLYLRQTVSRLCKFLCPYQWGRKARPKPTPAMGPRGQNGLSGNENGNFSGIVMHNLTTDDASRQERHARNRERWSRMVQRLGSKKFRWSLSASAGVSQQGEKPSDGTIDEEREEEKGQSSKGQSSSTSLKLANGVSGWEDWQQLIDMAAAKDDQTQHMMGESVTNRHFASDRL